MDSSGFDSIFIGSDAFAFNLLFCNCVILTNIVLSSENRNTQRINEDDSKNETKYGFEFHWYTPFLGNVADNFLL